MGWPGTQDFVSPPSHWVVIPVLYVRKLRSKEVEILAHDDILQWYIPHPHPSPITSPQVSLDKHAFIHSFNSYLLNLALCHA